MRDKMTCVVVDCPLSDRCRRKTITGAEHAVSYFCEGANVGTEKCKFFEEFSPADQPPNREEKP